MTFAELLREYIGDRTLDEMSRLCSRESVHLDPTYISKLRTGNRTAPDDEHVVRTMAEVCGRDPEPLLLLARLERNPHKAFSSFMQKVLAAFKANGLLVDRLHKDLGRVEEMAKAGESPESISTFLRQTQEDRLTLHDAKHRYHQAFFDVFQLMYLGIRDQLDPQAAQALPSDDELEAEIDQVVDRSRTKEQARVEVTEEDLTLQLANMVGVPEAALRSAIIGLRVAFDSSAPTKRGG